MINSPAHQKKSGPSRRKRKVYRLTRIDAEIKVIARPPATPTYTEARLMLTDISPKSLNLFSVNPIMVGQEIGMTLEEPRQIYLRGRVVSCQEYDADSHIISVKPYSYRMQIKFIFETPEERERVARFVYELVAYHNHEGEPPGLAAA